MLQTHLLCLPPPSPRSTTSSWGPSTASFVSPRNKSPRDVLSVLDCRRTTSASIPLSSLYRCPLPPGQLHSAPCRISQAVDLEASGVLHRQSLHQWPWDDALFIPTGHTISFYTQVSHAAPPPLFFLFSRIKLLSQWKLFEKKMSCFLVWAHCNLNIYFLLTVEWGRLGVKTFLTNCSSSIDQTVNQSVKEMNRQINW